MYSLIIEQTDGQQLVLQSTNIVDFLPLPHKVEQKCPQNAVNAILINSTGTCLARWSKPNPLNINNINIPILPSAEPVTPINNSQDTLTNILDKWQKEKHSEYNPDDSYGKMIESFKYLIKIGENNGEKVTDVINQLEKLMEKLDSK